MKFLKFLVPCTMVALAACMAACEDDNSGLSPEGGSTSGLTPDENKEKFESIASEVVVQFEPTDHEALLTAVNDFCRFSDYGYLEVDRDEFRSASTLMKALGDVCGKNNLGKVLLFAGANSDLYRAAQYYGIYTYANGTWSKSPSNDRLEFNFTTQDNRKVKFSATTSGSEVIFWKSTDDGETLAVPEHASATVTVNGSEVCNLTMNAQLNAAAKTANIEVSLNASGYIFACNVNATPNKATANFNMSKNGTNIISGNADVTGQRMTDPTEADEDNPQNLFNNASSRVNILDDAYVTASCSNIKGLVDQLDAIDAKYDWTQDEQCYKEQAIAVNNAVDVNLYYTTSSAVVASLEAHAYISDTYYNSYNGQTIEYWDLESIIVFDDGSKYSLDEYFDDDVTFGDLIDSYDELELQYRDYLDYFE